MKSASSNILVVIASAVAVSPSVMAACGAPPVSINSDTYQQVWNGDLSKGLAGWGEVRFQFGIQDLRFEKMPSGEYALRVVYPAGSYDPQSALDGKAPMGGAQFTAYAAREKLNNSQGVLLQYKVKFNENFDFVQGGKLPGLFGGVPRTGGLIPTGRDGYSVRIVWRKYGDGAIYAYLPTSKVMGTLFGERSWRFRPGQTYELALFVAPNTVGKEDGAIYFWVDSVLRVQANGLRFRDVNSFNVDGILFSTFFGGNTPDWGAISDTSADFSDFRLSAVNPAYCGK